MSTTIFKSFAFQAKIVITFVENTAMAKLSLLWVHSLTFTNNPYKFAPLFMIIYIDLFILSNNTYFLKKKNITI